MESEPMLTPKGKKSPLPEKFSLEANRTHDAASSRTASPKTLPTNYFGPLAKLVQGIQVGFTVTSC